MRRSISRIRENWRSPLDQARLAKAQKLAALLLLTLSLGCANLNRKLEASFWTNNFRALPADICATSVKDYGLYRRLNSGKLEFISVCNPLAGEMISIYNGELDDVLDCRVGDASK